MDIGGIMRFKICTKCERELPATTIFFHKLERGEFGLKYQCKKCCSVYAREYRENNFKHLQEYAHQKYQSNRQLILKQKKIYRQNNRKKLLERDKKYKQSEAGRKVTEQWRQSEKGRKSMRKINERYQQTEKGKEVKKLASKKYYERNRLSKSMSGGIRRSLRDDKINKHWEEFVPYTLGQLKEHLENLFQPNMSWNNYGEWHIDHIKPISKFNIISHDCKDFKECWSLCNLQPLWRLDNLKKSNKFQEEQKCF